MHYKNNKPAQNGDFVIAKEYGKVIAGVLGNLQPGATSCNGQIYYPIYGGFTSTCITVGNCLLASDCWDAFENSQAQIEGNKYTVEPGT